MAGIADFVEHEEIYNPELALQKISLEYAYVDNMVDTLRDLLPGMSNQLKDIGAKLVGFLDTNNEANKELPEFEATKTQRAALANMKQLSFLTYGETTVQVPENFHGNMTNYADDMADVLPALIKATTELLTEYTTILASFITNKDDKTALKEHESFYRRIEGQSKSVADRLKPYFPKLTGVTRAPLLKIFANFKNIEQSFECVNRVRNSHVIKNIEQINDKMKHATELLDIIIKDIHDGKLTQVGPSATKNLAQGAYAVAKIVEHLSAVYFSSIILVKMNDDIAAMIAK